MATALRTSIRFTNRIKGRSASLPEHRAVLEAITAGLADDAHVAMTTIIREVMLLISTAEPKAA